MTIKLLYLSLPPPPAGLPNIIIDFLASVPVPDILLYRLVPRLICLVHYFPFQDELVHRQSCNVSCSNVIGSIARMLKEVNGNEAKATNYLLVLSFSLVFFLSHILFIHLSFFLLSCFAIDKLYSKNSYQISKGILVMSVCIG